MPSIIATHEVDDVDHWLASKKRAEVFEGIATNLRTFVDPSNPNRVGISAEVPDMDALQAMLGSEAGAAAMAHDGVRPETVVLLVQS
jgi:replicative superfamily II helicase